MEVKLPYLSACAWMCGCVCFCIKRMWIPLSGMSEIWPAGWKYLLSLIIHQCVKSKERGFYDDTFINSLPTSFSFCQSLPSALNSKSHGSWIIHGI